jgi:hypothetical protein
MREDEEEEGEGTQKKRQIDVSSSILCTKCKMEMHSDRGQIAICSLCARGEQLLDTRSNCFERQKTEAEKMVTCSSITFPPLQINDTITLSVPTVDRGPLDFNNIFGVVTI